MSCKYLLCVCIVLSLWLCAWSGDEFYTNSWAVEVTGGRAAADEVARRHGFLNMGQVGRNHRRVYIHCDVSYYDV